MRQARTVVIILAIIFIITRQKCVGRVSTYCAAIHLQLCNPGHNFDPLNCDVNPAPLGNVRTNFGFSMLFFVFELRARTARTGRSCNAAGCWGVRIMMCYYGSEGGLSDGGVACRVLLQNPSHMRHPSPPHGVGQMSPHPMHGHMMPQMGQVCTPCLEKVVHQAHIDNLVNSQRIFIIPSLAHSLENVR